MEGGCDFGALADRHLSQQQYRSALYWADKQYSLTTEVAAGAAATAATGDLSKNEEGSGERRTADLVRLGRCLLLTGQPRRAAQLLLRGCGHNQQQQLQRRPDRQQQLLRHIDCCLLAAQALMDSGQLPEALELLQSLDTQQSEQQQQQQELPLPDSQQAASVQLLLGRVYQALDDRSQAVQCLWRALQLDVTCHEALDTLMGHQFLTDQEERKLMESLPFDEQLPAAAARAVRALYQLQLKKYTKVDSPERQLQRVAGQLPAQLLASNGDVLASSAERLYYDCQYDQCGQVCAGVLADDPDHPGCLPVHVACLVERRQCSRLFQLAHRLVSSYPESALAWYTVGAYYYTIGRMEPARRYLTKANVLSPVFGPSRLLYGHCFAHENEHDQAISAYLSAAQLMRGCHLPLLYVGREYGLTNNVRLAVQFFEQAQLVAPRDPHVLHEMGVAAFGARDYQLAERRFVEALTLIVGQQQMCLLNTEPSTTTAATADAPAPPMVAPDWEPLYNNLGHTYRKLGRYQAACRCHQRALLLRPRTASTHAALAFAHALAQQYAESVEQFHKALALRRDDAFSTQMLSLVLELLMSSASMDVERMGPCEQLLFGVDDNIQLRLATGAKQTPVASTDESLIGGGAVNKSAYDSSHEMSLDCDSDKG